MTPQDGRPDLDAQAAPRSGEAVRRARQFARFSRTQWRRLSRGTVRLWKHRWVRRSAIGVAAVMGILVIGVAALWWRLASGPIELDLATPWLTAAIQENFGANHTVTIGGTQIERERNGRTALRILNIVVRDADGSIVASAPKAEVGMSGASLLSGRLRAESLNLVGAELAIRIETDGRVTVFAGADGRPIASAPAATSVPLKPPSVAASPESPLRGGFDDLAALLTWLDGISDTGLDGHELNELGLKNGNLTVDDQRTGKHWTFTDINASLTRPKQGGVAFRLTSENPDRPWDLSAAMRPFQGGVRAVGIEARNVSAADVLLAARVGDGVVESDLPLSASLRGEFGPDGTLRAAGGQLVASAGWIRDPDNPDSDIHIERADIRFTWDGARQSLIVPFQVKTGRNQFTLVANASPDADHSGAWQVAVSRGDPVIDPVILGAKDHVEGLALNRIAVRARIDPNRRRVELEQGDIGRDDVRAGYNVGVAVSGSFDYSGDDPRLAFGVAGNRMSLNVMKQLWPAPIAGHVRRWVDERITAGTVERIVIAGNLPLSTLADPALALPDEGLSVDLETSGTTLKPIPQLPPIRDADLSVHVTGRTATVALGRGTIDVGQGRRLNIANGTFTVPDTHPKSAPASAQFRVDGAVSAAAAFLASDPLREEAGIALDPASSRGTLTAQATINLLLERDKLTKPPEYSLAIDLSNFAADKLLLGQKLEAQTLKVNAGSSGYQIKGDVKIGGTPASIDYHKTKADPRGDLSLTATLDEASRRRLGIDLGGGVSGSIPVKVTGRVEPDDKTTRLNVVADFTPAKIDNLLPGWVKPAGKSARATFTLVKDGKSTRFEDLTIDGQGALAKGTIELDATGDLTSAHFPVFALSDGDRVSLKADRSADSVLHVVIRGDVYDGREFVKSTMASSAPPPKGKSPKPPDLDLDVKIGAVAGHNGEALRGLELKLGRRNGQIRSFSLNARIGRDSPLLGDIRVRSRDNHRVIYLETDDAGALFRFSDIYPRMQGGQMWLAMDPPGKDDAPQVGILSVRNFSVRGEPALDRVLSGAPNNARSSVNFTELRCDFTKLPGRMQIRDGVVRGPTVGATIDGQIDFVRNDMRLRGTFVPLYAINNMFGQIPIVGIFLGGGSNEGLLGINYEASGPPSSPRVSINPISAVAPGLLRKLLPAPSAFDPNFVPPSR